MLRLLDKRFLGGEWYGYLLEVTDEPKGWNGFYVTRFVVSSINEKYFPIGELAGEYRYPSEVLARLAFNDLKQPL